MCYVYIHTYASLDLEFRTHTHTRKMKCLMWREQIWISWMKNSCNFTPLQELTRDMTKIRKRIWEKGKDGSRMKKMMIMSPFSINHRHQCTTKDRERGSGLPCTNTITTSSHYGACVWLHWLCVSRSCTSWKCGNTSAAAGAVLPVEEPEPLKPLSLISISLSFVNRLSSN